jgi:hypothetical protein
MEACVIILAEVDLSRVSLMSDTVITSPKDHSSQRTDPQRLAWGVLLMAFAIFCAICVITGIGVNFFLFQSTIPMTSLLSVARGSAGANEQLVDAPTSLSFNADIRTVAQSQVTLAFIDQEANNRLIASVTLKENTSLKLQSASRPRFDWSTTGYQVDLTRISGKFDILIAEGLGRDVSIRLTTSQGALVNLKNSGRYSIDTSEASVRVVTREGEAILIPPNLEYGIAISPQNQGIVYTSNSLVALKPGYTDLLRNSYFRKMNPNVTVGAELDGWVCANDANDTPRGSYRSQFMDGVMTLRLERYEDATSHGRTSCLQTFQPGLNLVDSPYNYFALRTTFRIHFQSLNACGFDGSECPLMLRMDYIDQQGEAKTWYHGFFSENDPQRESPVRCDSCAQEHESINKDIWYTYDSGSLFALFPPDQRPVSIIAIMFYASGHQYDVQISEVALVGGHVDEATPTS